MNSPLIIIISLLLAQCLSALTINEPYADSVWFTSTKLQVELGNVPPSFASDKRLELSVYKPSWIGWRIFDRRIMSVSLVKSLVANDEGYESDDGNDDDEALLRAEIAMNEQIRQLSDGQKLYVAVTRPRWFGFRKRLVKSRPFRIVKSMTF